jgi:hypothetical protein
VNAHLLRMEALVMGGTHEQRLGAVRSQAKRLGYEDVGTRVTSEGYVRVHLDVLEQMLARIEEGGQR